MVQGYLFDFPYVKIVTPAFSRQQYGSECLRLFCYKFRQLSLRYISLTAHDLANAIQQLSPRVTIVFQNFPYSYVLGGG